MRESAEQPFGRQHFDPRRRELERERQRIEPPTNRRHGGTVRGVRRKSGCTSRTRSTNRRTAGEPRQIGRRHRLASPASSASGPTAYSRSPRTRSGARLVTSMRSAATDVRRSATSGAASSTCSKLSSTSSVGRSPQATRARPGKSTRGDVRQPERLGDRRRDERGIPNGGQRHEHHAGGALRRDGAGELQRQSGLPAPPGPVSVMRRTAGSASHCRSVCRSASRPRRLVSGRGSETPLSSSTAACVAGRPRAPQQRVTSRTRQVECRGQRAHGLDLRPPSFSALERAYAMNRKARNRREFFLCVARSLAKCFQLRAK